MATIPSSALPDDIRESIAIGNVKSVAEQPSMLSNLAYANLINNVNLSQQNAVSNQQAMNQLGLTVTGKVVNLVANLSPLEAVAVVKMDTGNDIAQQLADLQSSLDPQSTPSAGPVPIPITPHRRLPVVINNPAGGSTTTTDRRDFPLTLNVADTPKNPEWAHPRGSLVTLTPTQLPATIHLGGQVQPSSQTNLEVKRDRFPVQLKLGAGEGGLNIETNPDGMTVFVVDADKFPVVVRFPGA